MPEDGGNDIDPRVQRLRDDPPRIRLGDLTWVIASLAAVLFGAATVYDVPLQVAGLSGLGLLAVILLTVQPRLEPQLVPRRTGRRAPAWPDAGMKVVADGLKDPCILTSADGIVRYVNVEATERFGAIRPGDPLSFRLRVPAIHEALGRISDGGSAEIVAWSEKVPAERWYEAHVAPIRFPSDLTTRERKPDFVLVVVVDLSEQRRSERMRADFVANASHELRTPLASLTGFIETLQGPARNDPVARERFLGIMAEQAGRMRRLIDDLLSLSRIEMKSHVRPDTIVDVGAVLAQVIEALAPLSRENKVVVGLRRPPQPLQVRGDRDELVQVFVNLIENAIKYGASGGKVDLNIQEESVPSAGGSVYAISVTDYGPGISADHLPRLTERFYRADHVSSRDKQGTGLGLAIVKHILNRHRGRLMIESGPGRGATFTVRLDAES